MVNHFSSSLVSSLPCIFSLHSYFYLLFSSLFPSFLLSFVSLSSPLSHYYFLLFYSPHRPFVFIFLFSLFSLSYLIVFTSPLQSNPLTLTTNSISSPYVFFFLLYFLNQFLSFIFRSHHPSFLPFVLFSSSHPLPHLLLTQSYFLLSLSFSFFYGRLFYLLSYYLIFSQLILPLVTDSPVLNIR